MKKTETDFQREIMVSVSQMPNTRVWRNNVGLFYTSDGRAVQCGLCPGSSDLIGFRTRTITREMVGTKIAQFVAIEVKTATGKLSQIQNKFLDMVAHAGGYAVVAKPGLSIDIETIKK